jgi:RHS repeat-associated protein
LLHDVGQQVAAKNGRGQDPRPAFCGSSSHSLAQAILDATGFYNLGARYYDPASGRFLSPDPLGHASSTSLYDYANGDPVNGLDVDGRTGVNNNIESGESGPLGYDVATEGQTLGVSESSLSNLEQVATNPEAAASMQDLAQSVQEADDYRAENGPTYTGGDVYATPGDDMPESAAQQISEGLGYTPGAGQLLQGFEAISGYNPITQSYLSTDQQLGAAGGTILGAALPMLSLEGSVAADFGEVAESADLVSTGKLGGTLASPSDLSDLGEYLGQNGFTLKVGDEFLPPNANGAFNASEQSITLGSNPTQYQVLHELQHFNQFQELGPEAYSAQSTAAKEQHVFDSLENYHWDSLNYEEQQHAIWYVNQSGGFR